MAAAAAGSRQIPTGVPLFDVAPDFIPKNYKVPQPTDVAIAAVAAGATRVPKWKDMHGDGSDDANARVLPILLNHMLPGCGAAYDEAHHYMNNATFRQKSQNLFDGVAFVTGTILNLAHKEKKSVRFLDVIEAAFNIVYENLAAFDRDLQQVEGRAPRETVQAGIVYRNALEGWFGDVVNGFARARDAPDGGNPEVTGATLGEVLEKLKIQDLAQQWSDSKIKTYEKSAEYAAIRSQAFGVLGLEAPELARAEKKKKKKPTDADPGEEMAKVQKFVTDAMAASNRVTNAVNDSGINQEADLVEFQKKFRSVKKESENAMLLLKTLGEQLKKFKAKTEVAKAAIPGYVTQIEEMTAEAAGILKALGERYDLMKAAVPNAAKDALERAEDDDDSEDDEDWEAREDEANDEEHERGGNIELPSEFAEFVPKGNEIAYDAAEVIPGGRLPKPTFNIPVMPNPQAGQFGAMENGVIEAREERALKLARNLVKRDNMVVLSAANDKIMRAAFNTAKTAKNASAAAIIASAKRNRVNLLTAVGYIIQLLRTPPSEAIDTVRDQIDYLRAYILRDGDSEHAMTARVMSYVSFEYVRILDYLSFVLEMHRQGFSGRLRDPAASSLTSSEVNAAGMLLSTFVAALSNDLIKDDEKETVKFCMTALANMLMPRVIYTKSDDMIKVLGKLQALYPDAVGKNGEQDESGRLTARGKLATYVNTVLNRTWLPYEESRTAIAANLLWSTNPKDRKVWTSFMVGMMGYRLEMIDMSVDGAKEVVTLIQEAMNKGMGFLCGRPDAKWFLTYDQSMDLYMLFPQILRYPDGASTLFEWITMLIKSNGNKKSKEDKLFKLLNSNLLGFMTTSRSEGINAEASKALNKITRSKKDKEVIPINARLYLLVLPGGEKVPIPTMEARLPALKRFSVRFTPSINGLTDDIMFDNLSIIAEKIEKNGRSRPGIYFEDLIISGAPSSLFGYAGEFKGLLADMRRFELSEEWRGVGWGGDVAFEFIRPGGENDSDTSRIVEWVCAKRKTVNTVLPDNRGRPSAALLLTQMMYDDDKECYMSIAAIDNTLPHPLFGGLPNGELWYKTYRQWGFVPTFPFYLANGPYVYNTFLKTLADRYGMLLDAFYYYLEPWITMVHSEEGVPVDVHEERMLAQFGDGASKTDVRRIETLRQMFYVIGLVVGLETEEEMLEILNRPPKPMSAINVIATSRSAKDIQDAFFYFRDTRIVVSDATRAIHGWSLTDFGNPPSITVSRGRFDIDAWPSQTAVRTHTTTRALRTVADMTRYIHQRTGDVALIGKPAYDPDIDIDIDDDVPPPDKAKKGKKGKKGKPGKKATKATGKGVAKSSARASMEESDSDNEYNGESDDDEEERGGGGQGGPLTEANRRKRAEKDSTSPAPSELEIVEMTDARRAQLTRAINKAFRDQQRTSRAVQMSIDEILDSVQIEEDDDTVERDEVTTVIAEMQEGNAVYFDGKFVSVL